MDFDNITLELIKHLRKAEQDFLDEENLEGAYWCVDLTVYEMDSEFKKPLKKVCDYGEGYARWWQSND